MSEAVVTNKLMGPWYKYSPKRAIGPLRPRSMSESLLKFRFKDNLLNKVESIDQGLFLTDNGSSWTPRIAARYLSLSYPTIYRLTCIPVADEQGNKPELRNNHNMDLALSSAKLERIWPAYEQPGGANEAILTSGLVQVQQLILLKKYHGRFSFFQDSVTAGKCFDILPTGNTIRQFWSAVIGDVLGFRGEIGAEGGQGGRDDNVWTYCLKYSAMEASFAQINDPQKVSYSVSCAVKGWKGPSKVCPGIRGVCQVRLWGAVWKDSTVIRSYAFPIVEDCWLSDPLPLFGLWHPSIHSEVFDKARIIIDKLEHHGETIFSESNLKSVNLP